MHQLLSLKSTVQTDSGHVCRVESFIGGGGQGEVYRAQLDGQPIALKWYFPEQATPAQRQSLETLIRKGPPSAHFLWPLELITAPNIAGFGYLMPLREPRYKGIVDLMKRRIDPSFRTLGVAGLQLAQAFLELHAQGLCYRDIAFGNVFLIRTAARFRCAITIMWRLMARVLAEYWVRRVLLRQKWYVEKLRPVRRRIYFRYRYCCFIYCIFIIRLKGRERRRLSALIYRP